LKLQTFVSKVRYCFWEIDKNKGFSGYDITSVEAMWGKNRERERKKWVFVGVRVSERERERDRVKGEQKEK
jgi:hypothetical protein